VERRAAVPGPGVRRHPPPRPTLHRQGGTSFTYVTSGLADAISQARAAANGKNVAIAGGGTLLREVIRLGLLDELELHVVPVIHVRYKIDGRRPLVLDNRGQDPEPAIA
jgi:dihydrofolate reductase